MTAFFDFNMTALDGSADLLGPLRGRVVLAVNVASRCGYTPQYRGLEQLYQETQGAGLTVIGFPCNQFGAQEPGTAAEIQSFCSTTYQVSFPLSAKLEVNGPGRHPLYAWLTDPAQGFGGDIEWNFEKFLLDRDGALLKRYPAGTKPQDSGLIEDIATAL